MSAIGYVCVQWSILEHVLLHAIFALTDMPHEQGEIAFGGMDIQPRVNAALNLARFQKAPRMIQSGLLEIRKAIQGGLSDSRNLVVHGVHSDGSTPDAVRLHMSRWGGDKKETELTAPEIHQIGLDIRQQVAAAWDVFIAIGDWKFGGHRVEARDGHLR